MTEHFEDHDPADDFNEPGLDGPENGMGSARAGMAGNLAEAWRTRPMFKFMVLLIAVFAVGVAAFSFMGGGSSSPGNTAQLVSPPNLKQPPGGAVSPYMRQQTELADKERTQQAIASGGSAIPTPIGQNSDVGGFGDGGSKDETLNELRAETEQLKQQVQQQQVQQQQMQQQAQQQRVQQQQNQPFDNSLAEAMQTQMRQLLDSWKPDRMKDVMVATPEELKADKAQAAVRNAAATEGAANGSVQTVSSSVLAPPKPIVPAGTVSYAQLLTEANSDVPGPIMVQIVSGPLSGARAIGSFQVSDGYEKYLVLQFSIADIKGKDYRINAIALDPNTTLGGMATEVDERYLVRVVLPAAAGFLQGLGQAMGQGNSSISTNGTTTLSTTTGNGFKQGMYNGLGQAAQTMGQFFQNQANLTRPLVVVAAGTPMGLFFTQPVYDPDTQQGALVQQTSAAGAVPAPGSGTAPNGYYGNAAAYPGTTVNGYGASPYGNQAYGATGTNAAASGVPYPNYAAPGTGYVNSAVSQRTTNPFSAGATPGFGQ
ncbi:MAG: DotG/IcmE/VirB10 family protein [Alphaproteobacteria bacterium]|nr:DotG/IcmE/VirB10 family protein [Alphaproteobacteria bacterium]